MSSSSESFALDELPADAPANLESSWLADQLRLAALELSSGAPFGAVRPRAAGRHPGLGRALDDFLRAAAARERSRQHEYERQQEVMAAFEELARDQAAELARQNEELRRQNDELRRANQLKGDFVAMVSHELRTPLNSVIGFSELLMGGIAGELQQEQAEYVSIIMRSGRNLLDMINDMLDLARLEAGRMDFRQEALDLREPVVEAEHLAVPLAQKKELCLVLDAQGPAWCLGDSQRLRQIALNLMSNAVKFTPRGGTIRVSVRATAEAAELCVQDTGIGIDPANHERIFEAFRQVDGSATREYCGSGLGLALVKKFAEGMGGRVSVDSRLGEGARFTVRLPVPRSCLTR